MNRKLRKLINNPKLFWKDAVLKRINKPSTTQAVLAASPFAKVTKGNFQYVVISAVYNVEEYLDHYFRSLARQTLDFTNNITLILVDDGSTDSSAEIIKRWQTRYPENIIYLNKENGGQASARNFGLDYIEENFEDLENFDYVTFIDPDDFVDVKYFRSVDDFSARHGGQERIAMIGCNLIFYAEKTGAFSDTHLLKFRFSGGDIVVPVEKMDKHIQLSAPSAFFCHEQILLHRLRFDERIKPNFEDGHFAALFLLHAMGRKVAFLRSAKYFYRKRSSQNSTLDNKIQDKRHYTAVPKYGHLSLINISHELGGAQLPHFIQRTLLYEMCSYLMWDSLINEPDSLSHLSTEEQDQFLLDLDAIFAAIDVQTILEFDLARIWFFQKVGMLNCFKGEIPPFQIVYLENIDVARNQIQLRYFSGEVGLEKFIIDGQDVAPHHTKTVKHGFLGRTFAMERWVWLPFPEKDLDASLSIELQSYDNVRISLKGRQFRNGVKVSDIRKSFGILDDTSPEELWLLMDRDIQADDNAEHLYRHVMNEHPEKNIKFVLRRKSHDWTRLQQDGFDLVPYGSLQHRKLLRKCTKIVSSHIDQNIVDFFRDGSLKQKPLIFLQHGVIKDDLSSWLNGKHIDLFVTTAREEYASIVANDSGYKFTKREIALTGLPRHDALLRRQQAVRHEKLILIMPTWRSYLVGRVIDGSIREKDPKFMASDYAMHWKAVLTSDRLRAMTEKHGYRVIFFPHSNTIPYLDDFDLPDHIEVFSHKSGTIQDLFCRATMMVTDYSSVAFEMALLQKQTLYFQFDSDEFFRSHLYRKGYFDYKKHGFGPTCSDENTLLEALERSLEADAKPEAKYAKRMDEFFAFRDEGNCERTYNAICALDDANSPPDRNAVFNHAEAATNAQQWTLAEGRWRYLLSLEDGVIDAETRAYAQKQLAGAIININPALANDIAAGLKALKRA